VWLLLQRKIDDVLDSVHLADLLSQESEVRIRVGLTDAPVEHADSRALPILQT
jgi:hypothetical protein